MLAKKSLLKFIDQQIDADDQVALITTSGRLGLYEQFTTDREALRRAINRLSPQERSRASQFDTPRITPYQAERIDDNDPEALEIAVQEIVRDMNMQRPQAVNLAQSKARMLVAENVAVTTSTLSTIENMIRGLKQLPGRKIMVLVSDGFLLGSFRDGKHFDVRRITDSATKAGVVIYSLDARGLIAEAGSMDASQPNTTPLN
ncbi:MAG: VWA domain-containing protein [Acidobacteria bacterium]|nr:VWA domain-containing protein [Acidobacteriota bacterium]